MRSRFQFSWASLRTRIILLVLLAVLPALGLTIYTAAQEHARENVEARENVLRLARIVSVEEEQLVENIKL